MSDSRCMLHWFLLVKVKCRHPAHQVEVGAIAAGQQLLGVVEEVERKVKDGACTGMEVKAGEKGSTRQGAQWSATVKQIRRHKIAGLQRRNDPEFIEMRRLPGTAWPSTSTWCSHRCQPRGRHTMMARLPCHRQGRGEAVWMGRLGFDLRATIATRTLPCKRRHWRGKREQLASRVQPGIGAAALWESSPP